MSEDITPVEEPQTDSQQEKEPQTDEKTFDAAYVTSIREESKSRRLRIAELEKQIKDFEEAKLQEQQEWQQLAEKRAGELEALQPYKERYEGILANIDASNKRRIDAIPDQMKGLVPDFNDPSKLASWLDANAQVLTKPLAPELNGDAGDGSRPTEQITLTEEQLKVARSMGLTAEEYKKATMRT